LIAPPSVLSQSKRTQQLCSCWSILATKELTKRTHNQGSIGRAWICLGWQIEHARTRLGIRQYGSIKLLDEIGQANLLFVFDPIP
ncbi:hypothetical protein, partial [Staphylococcus aureus]